MPDCQQSDTERPKVEIRKAIFGPVVMLKGVHKQTTLEGCSTYGCYPAQMNLVIHVLSAACESSQVSRATRDDQRGTTESSYVDLKGQAELLDGHVERCG